MEQNVRQLRFVVTKVLWGWFLLVLFCVPSPVYSGTLREFPGPKTELKSPHGRYLVKNIDTVDEPYHALMLKDTKTGAVRTLCAYGRSVSVVWSPDGKKLVVNDELGSDYSKSLIFFVDQDSPPRDVGAELLQSLKNSPDQESVAHNQHVYIAISRWQGNNAVKLKVWGSGKVDPKGFSRLYLYSIGGAFRRLHQRHL
jgi:hypothetical protein